MPRPELKKESEMGRNKTDGIIVKPPIVANFLVSMVSVCVLVALITFFH